MRFEASVKNAVSSIIMQLITSIVGLVLPRLYIISFGSEINGLVSSITQFISYFTLVEAGLASAATASLYAPLAEKNGTRVNQILSASRKFYFQVGYIFSSLVIGLALLYPLFLSTKSLTPLKISILVLILGFNGAFDFFSLAKYRVLLTADQKFYIIANVSTIATIVNFTLVYISIKLSFGIIIVRLVALTSFVLRSLILNVYVRRYYRYINYSLPPDNNALSKRWDAMILQFLGLAQTSMPVVLLTIFTKDLSVVSVYSVYNMVASSILMLLMAFTNGFAGTFGDMLAKKEFDNFKRAYKEYEVVFFSLMIWAYSCMNILFMPFITLYTSGITDANYIKPIVALLFVINGITYNLKTPAGTLIGSAGAFKETKSATIIQTGIAIVIALMLTPTWGIFGLLISLIISNLYRDIELVLFMSKNITKLSFNETYKRMIRFIITFLVSNLPFYFINLEPSCIGIWIFNAISVAIWCLMIVILYNLIFERSIMLSIISRVKKVEEKFQGGQLKSENRHINLP